MGVGEAFPYADIDIGRIIEEKQTLDVVGHYARPEVFRLLINRGEMAPAAFHKGQQDSDAGG